MTTDLHLSVLSNQPVCLSVFLLNYKNFQLVESESVARSFSSRMEEQGIPFYRFNPQLDEVVPSGETDLVKLVNMVIKVSQQVEL